jgi:low affinity Fe/Cu permease
MLSEAVWLAIISAVTAIVGYIVGLIRNSSNSTTKNFSTLYNTLLESNKQLREQIDVLQKRSDEAENRFEASKKEHEKELRKLRQENLEQAQELASFRAIWKELREELPRDFVEGAGKPLFDSTAEFAERRRSSDRIKRLDSLVQKSSWTDVAGFGECSETRAPETKSDSRAETRTVSNRPKVKTPLETTETVASKVKVATNKPVASKTPKILEDPLGEYGSLEGWDNFTSDKPTKKYTKRND